MASEHLLPKAFQELEPFARDWALATEAAREEKRMSTSMDEHRQFYDAILPRMDELSEYLKEVPPREADMSEEQRTLVHLMLAFMETAVAVEIFDDVTSPLGIDWRRKERLHE